MELEILNIVKFDENGLVPVIAQDAESKEVLMLAYMNDEALKKTVYTGNACYFSRSRNCLWQKGETSGNTQIVKDIRYDCDQDTLLILVEQNGAACHTGHKSCFYRNLQNEELSSQLFEPEDMYSAKILKELYEVIVNRRDNPVDGSYTNYLFDKGLDKILKKVGEESAEVIIASKNEDKNELVYEIGDLIYHISVLMVNKNITWNEIFNELQGRSGKKSK